MKTSKSNVRFRFGRLLSGILSAAMLFSAAAFQIPVSADDEVGGYEVLYDFVKDGYLTDSKVSDNGTDTFKAISTYSYNYSLASNIFSEPITGKTVRFHFETMHEYSAGCPKWYAAVVDDNTGFDEPKNRWLGIAEYAANAGGPYKICYYGGEENWNLTETTQPAFEKDRWYSVDTIYDLANSKASYYIDGEKIGESTGPTQIMQAGLRFMCKEMDQGTSYYKNMKLDTEWRLKLPTQTITERCSSLHDRLKILMQAVSRLNALKQAKHRLLPLKK